LELQPYIFTSETAMPFFILWRPHTETDLFVSCVLGDRSGDFFDAKMIVLESGGEGSRERRSGTRLQLPSVVAAVSSTVVFSAAATASAAGFFI
jgi:hypothetical protein